MGTEECASVLLTRHDVSSRPDINRRRRRRLRSRKRVFFSPALITHARERTTIFGSQSAWRPLTFAFAGIEAAGGRLARRIIRARD